MDENAMALVASFALQHDASLAKAMLDAAGIPAFLSNENVNRLNIIYAMSEGGLHLYVPASAADDARELLSSRVSDQDLEAESRAGIAEG